MKCNIAILDNVSLLVIHLSVDIVDNLYGFSVSHTSVEANLLGKVLQSRANYTLVWRVIFGSVIGQCYRLSRVREYGNKLG